MNVASVTRGLLRAALAAGLALAASAANVPRWWQWRMDHVPGWTARHLRK